MPKYDIHAVTQDGRKLVFTTKITIGPHPADSQLYKKKFSDELPVELKRKFLKDVLEKEIRDLASSMTAEPLLAPLELAVKTSIITRVCIQLYKVGAVICRFEVETAPAEERVGKQQVLPSFAIRKHRDHRPSRPTPEKLKSLRILQIPEKSCDRSSKKPAKAPAPEPIMREIIRAKLEELRATKLMWVNEKEITKSDLRQDQNRLYLPNQIGLSLTKAEWQLTQKGPENKIPVVVVDYTGKTWNTTVRYWNGVTRYVLVENWINYSRMHGIQEKDKYELWSFRVPNHEQMLYLAFNIPNLPRKLKCLEA